MLVLNTPYHDGLTTLTYNAEDGRVHVLITHPDENRPTRYSQPLAVFLRKVGIPFTPLTLRTETPKSLVTADTSGLCECEEA